MKIFFSLLLTLCIICNCYSQQDEKHYKKGLAKANKENYKGSIEEFNQAIAVDPNNFYAYVKRGFSKFKLENDSGAITDYNKAIALSPNYSYAYVYRGILKNKQGDCESAIEDFKIAIKIIPTNSHAYVYMGISTDKLHDYTGAINAYNKAIEISPGEFSAFFYRAISKFNMLDYKGAITDFYKVLELLSKNDDKRITKSKQAAYKNAIKESQLVSPRIADFYFNNGKSDYTEQYYEKAITNLNITILINPDYTQAYYYRGLSKIGLNQNDSGCIDLNKANKLGDVKANEAINKYCK
jgi:tetratricopeptide (TPR) repeat protein